ncbi:MAG: DUF2236 domain-containing protein [Pedobacter sp.]|nr:MAG: DUF2236 domain-containing protein [Pedobacter sp.]
MSESCLFVEEQSIVRKIWGNGDTILFIFAGASAEFALNKAVDWLYFTGRLPADPLGRLFSTVSYAREIVFSSEEDALKAIDRITAIHTSVESARGAQIPDWAYRDVLYMLIDYSIRSFEVLQRKLSDAEKEEAFNVFYRMGLRMGLKDLPTSYVKWLPSRASHLHNDLVYSKYTADLFNQYKKHLGALRYKLLTEAQAILVPKTVGSLLGLNDTWLIKPLLSMYKIGRNYSPGQWLRKQILPKQYRKQIDDLDNKN